jgi:SAM-dependent methyltransferase
MTSSSETTPTWTHIATTYDAVADDYADKFSDELDGKPFDRELLDQLARGVAGRGPVVDLGCGPGQIGAYLAASGCDVIGVDLAPGMIRSAREQHPDLRFELGDLRALPLADDSCAGIACFYSLIHLRRAEIPAAVSEMGRVLRDGGRLLLAVHGVVGEYHVDDWFGKGVGIDLTLFSGAELLQLLEKSGFSDCRLIERAPYPAEHATPRLFFQATR